MKALFNIAVLLWVLAGTAISARAQVAVPPPMAAYQPLSAAQLDQLLGPIALYPDPLIAQILPASTLPTEIVLADRYVTSGGDPNQLDQQPWDSSVQALARYPSVLQWMDENLDWTTELGQAFLNQQQDVMDAIQRLRWSAYNLGNLQSTPQQQVIVDGGDIEIVPVDEQVVYLPVYQPDQVYYDAASGGPFMSFGAGWAIGPWLDCDFDWGHHNLIVWGRGHARPAHWWHQPPRQRDMGHTTVWHRENNPRGVVGNRGDRGWGTPVNQNVVATIGRPLSANMIPRSTPTPAAQPRPAATRYSPPVVRPVPAQVEHIQPASRPESNGALIGIESSHDTKAYSNRGQQSTQTITHSEPAVHAEPASRPAPAAPTGGGGGGGGGGGHGAKH